jgi:Right handed beta helix region/Pectate lyase superfamily protein
MPTIDELPPAVSVSDGDELPVSQSDTARKATRAQILAGVQPALAVSSGSLLGRISAGVGAPEQIAIGANLAVVNGVISAPAPFVIASLEAGITPQPTDLVAIADGGQNAAVSYATFMGGLDGVAGLDGSQLEVAPTGGVGSRRLCDLMADAISIESFGAVGDGVTDNTQAFLTALASGRALRLDSRVYIVNGALNAQQTPAILGVPGGTVIRRNQLLVEQPWITASSSVFLAYGIVFDAGNLAASDMPSVTVAASCQSTVFARCQFVNATGPTQGHGVLLNTGSGSSHELQDSLMTGNAQSGAAVSGPGFVAIRNSSAVGNGACGISITVGTGFLLASNVCSTNQIGLSVGDWSAEAGAFEGTPGGMVAGNLCCNNTEWGLTVGATAATVIENIAQGNGSHVSGGGALVRLSAGLVANNSIVGGACGVDARICQGTSITGNYISGCAVGIAVGGTQNGLVRGNQIAGNGWGILVTAIEPTLSPAPTGSLTLSDNWIGFSSAQGGGISILDGALGISVVDNDINGWGSSSVAQALWAHTDAIIVNGNRWNNQVEFALQVGIVAGLPALVVPDVADRALITAAAPTVSAILTSHQADTLGQITFLRVESGGGGYTEAQVSLSGTGTGAAATAVVANGQVVWLVVTNPGSGYGAIGANVQAIISGDGAGATASAFVGLPVIEARRLRLSCNAPVRLVLVGSIPPQTSWSGFDTTIPAFGAAELEGTFGSWRIVTSPPVDYVAPTGDGGVVVQSVAGGDVTLRPSSGGALQVASATEPLGCTFNVGRGAPTGQLSAPPGSDYRNLDGGVGNTFWIKQSGTDSSGWIAVA